MCILLLWRCTVRPVAKNQFEKTLKLKVFLFPKSFLQILCALICTYLALLSQLGKKALKECDSKPNVSQVVSKQTEENSTKYYRVSQPNLIIYFFMSSYCAIG